MSIQLTPKIAVNILLGKFEDEAVVIAAFNLKGDIEKVLNCEVSIDRYDNFNQVDNAIEAGSERLRKVINKHLSEEQIFNAVKIAKDNGLKSIKFYGMIGLPTETYEDLNELLRLAKKLKKQNKGFDITFGFSSFVPKPNTPFQWIGREDIKSLEKKSNYIKKELHKIGISANISSIKWDYWQAVLSRGDASLNDFLIEAYKQGGKLGAFKAAAKKIGINPDVFAYKNYSFDEKLPWDFIEINPGKEFLIKENIRLLNGSVITVD